MLSPCAGAPGSAATTRSAILCLFHVFLIQSCSALIRSLCSLSFPESQWQHSEGCLGCVSCTALGKAALAPPSPTGQVGNWGQEPGLEPASPTRAGQTFLLYKTLWRGFLMVCWGRGRGTASPCCLSLRFPAGNETRAGLICRACASALPFSLKQFPRSPAS